MLEIIHHRPGASSAEDSTLTLSFDQRSRSRSRTRLDDGREAGLCLPRGTLLRGGDLLLTADGLRIRVQAADEQVSTAHTGDPLLLARACYHLGNRHVALQIDHRWIRYQHDHVLDDMVRGLGLELISENAPFEPETGAYHGHTHGDKHEHQHRSVESR